MVAAIERVSLVGKLLVTYRPSGAPAIVAAHADVVCKVGSLSDFAIRSLVFKICRQLGKTEQSLRLLKQIEHYPQLRSNPFTLTLLTQFACHSKAPIEELRIQRISLPNQLR